MKVCKKCGEAKRDAQFVWDDGILLGESEKCKACRRPCVDCKRSHGRIVERCTRCRAMWRGPVYPAFRYRVRHHAVRRFIERVRPGASGPAALLEMLELAGESVESLEPPAWVVPSSAPSARFHRGYLLVSDDVVFALAVYGEKGVMVSTVMTRTGGGQS